MLPTTPLPDMPTRRYKAPVAPIICRFSASASPPPAQTISIQPSRSKSKTPIPPPVVSGKKRFPFSLPVLTTASGRAPSSHSNLIPENSAPPWLATPGNGCTAASLSCPPEDFFGSSADGFGEQPHSKQPVRQPTRIAAIRDCRFLKRIGLRKRNKKNSRLFEEVIRHLIALRAVG